MIDTPAGSGDGTDAAITALVAAAATLPAAMKPDLLRRLVDLFNVERAQDEKMLSPEAQRDMRLVRALRSVADTLGHPPATTEYVAAHKRARAGGDTSLPSVSTFIKRYGTWKAALFAAGVTGMPHSNLIDQRRRLRGRPYVYPRARILACLQSCAADLARVPTTKDYRAWREEKRRAGIARGRMFPDFPCVTTITAHFQGWGNALRCAGFDDRLDQRNPPEWWTPLDSESSA